MPEYKYYEDYEIGEKQVTSSRTMTEADIRLFIGCSDNTHPAIKGCIVQGVLTLGVADGFMAREIGPSKVPTVHYGHDKVRYIKPVYPGDSIHCETEVIDKYEKNEQFGVVTWNVNVVNQNNEVVLFHIDKQYIGRRPADKKE